MPTITNFDPPADAVILNGQCISLALHLGISYLKRGRGRELRNSKGKDEPNWKGFL
ncbi:hypothetical protein L873DRAFT_1807114 [Choiromyces venosus 120613-1]|uniref:Uncharacterized protein n=1 Tax=Choiromyces venosus 120613-1 TaxID=1336337 RepID=A0A3N4JLT4_9PEZI|nr:hypothetical protein L873DRAFT_1807114 [Choiromyces venosus 120613-1]